MEESTLLLSAYAAEIEYDLRRVEAEIEVLKDKRNYLLSQKKRLDMAVVLECIEETGLSANEVMEMLATYRQVGKKRFQAESQTIPLTKREEEAEHNVLEPRAFQGMGQIG